MSDDAIARPSLLLARHDIAHREHNHNHNHNHLHQHHKAHKRQTDSSDGVVTEVVTTISVIQEIDVDSNGNTYSTLLIPAATPPLLTITTPSIPVVNNAASPVPGAPSSYPSGQSPLSLPYGQSAISAPTSTPSIPTSFSSLIVNPNSTTCKPSIVLGVDDI
jgi:hypothetical protein